MLFPKGFKVYDRYYPKPIIDIESLKVAGEERRKTNATCWVMKDNFEDEYFIKYFDKVTLKRLEGKPGFLKTYIWENEDWIKIKHEV